MDKTLARAIWDVINSSHNWGRLRYLRLSIFKEWALTLAKRRAIRHVARSFLISKLPSSTKAGLELPEIRRQERELRAKRKLRYIEGRLPYYGRQSNKSSKLSGLLHLPGLPGAFPGRVGRWK